MAAQPAAPRKLTTATKTIAGDRQERRPGKGLHLIILIGRRAPGRGLSSGRK